MEKPENTAPASQPPEHDERVEFGLRFNGRISYICKLVALVIGIVVVATSVLGRLDYEFAFLGLATAVVLLALASLQQHDDDKRRP